MLEIESLSTHTVSVNIERDCEVLEVHGSDGDPPYTVRWEENGHEAIFFPGPDASVQHFEDSSR